MEKRKNVFEQLELFARRGNPDALRRYWETGAGGQAIGWGAPEEGDLTRCFELVGEKVPEWDADQIWGFCQERKMAVSGMANATADALAEASTENVTELSEEESSVTLGNNADLKTKGEHQERRKCAMCGKSYLGQKNSSTCGDACRKAKSRKG